MRLTLTAALSAAALLAIIGCSSAGPGATQAPGSTLPPGVTQPPPGGPTVAPPPVDVSQLCAGQPTYSPDAPAPSFAQDETLNARFPTQIDGQPVTDVSSAFYLQSICFYGGSAESIAKFVAIFPPGSAALISSGSGEVVLDGETVDISAFRIPGGDPNAIFSHLPEFLTAFGGDPADAANTTVTTTNIGGKNVYVVTDADGDVDYDYVSGDTIWTVDTSDLTITAKVFGAIQ